VVIDPDVARCSNVSVSRAPRTQPLAVTSSGAIAIVDVYQAGVELFTLIVLVAPVTLDVTRTSPALALADAYTAHAPVRFVVP
jgi:hypothetical protein